MADMFYPLHDGGPEPDPYYFRDGWWAVPGKRELVRLPANRPVPEGAVLVEGASILWHVSEEEIEMILSGQLPSPDWDWSAKNAVAMPHVAELRRFEERVSDLDAQLRKLGWREDSVLWWNVLKEAVTHSWEDVLLRMSQDDWDELRFYVRRSWGTGDVLEAAHELEISIAEAVELGF